ncbi:50S ribosomal protein L27 [Candidatus Saccharibacteria bacterium]|nr:50S ribosomal protein L27 [Candidatus Saccharibacteria bacterium]MCB9821366.1 50S ribosomal protein L27 [Candidatus Nomurabacteria bacterium]
MSKVKGQGSTKNTKKTAGKRLGVKRFAGQAVKTGDIIVRQVGATKRSGEGTYMARNFSIHAAKDGVVKFNTRNVRRFTGKTAPRTEVIVE